MGICRYFLQGACKFGDRCKFEHVSRHNNRGNSSGGSPFGNVAGPRDPFSSNPTNIASRLSGGAGGNNGNSGFGSFGNPNGINSGFNNNNNNNNNSLGNSSAFGHKVFGTNSNVFGGNAQNNAFGKSFGSPFGNQSLFGSNNQVDNSPVGGENQTGSNPFGASTHLSNNPFGASNKTASSPFWATSQAGNNPFGANNQTTTSPFGRSNQIGISPFGTNKQPGPSSFEGAFGQNSNNSGFGLGNNNNSGSVFGAKSQPVTGEFYGFGQQNTNENNSNQGFHSQPFSSTWAFNASSSNINTFGSHNNGSFNQSNISQNQTPATKEVPIWALSCYGEDRMPCSLQGDISQEEQRYNDMVLIKNGANIVDVAHRFRESLEKQKSSLLAHYSDTNPTPSTGQSNFGFGASNASTGQSIGGFGKVANTGAPFEQQQNQSPINQSSVSFDYGPLNASNTGNGEVFNHNLNETKTNVEQNKSASPNNEASHGLSKEEIAQYNASNFEVNHIPENPPPRELC